SSRREVRGVFGRGRRGRGGGRRGGGAGRAGAGRPRSFRPPGRARAGGRRGPAPRGSGGLLGAVSASRVRRGRAGALARRPGGLAKLRAMAGPSPARETSLERFARLASGQPLSSAFARLVADWKREGFSTGDRDVLLLAARRG